MQFYADLENNVSLIKMRRNYGYSIGRGFPLKPAGLNEKLSKWFKLNVFPTAQLAFFFLRIAQCSLFYIEFKNSTGLADNQLWRTENV